MSTSNVLVPVAPQNSRHLLGPLACNGATRLPLPHTAVRRYKTIATHCLKPVTQLGIKMHVGALQLSLTSPSPRSAARSERAPGTGGGWWRWSARGPVPTARRGRWRQVRRRPIALRAEPRKMREKHKRRARPHVRISSRQSGTDGPGSLSDFSGVISVNIIL